MATVLYYVRTTSKKKNPTVNIRVKFGVNSKVYYGKTQHLIELKGWNQNAQKAKYEIGKDGASDLNTELINLEKFILAEYNKITNKDKIDSNWVQEKINNYDLPKIEKEEKELLFIEYLDNFNAKLAKRKGKRTSKVISNGHLKKMKTNYKYLKEFVEGYNKRLLLKEVDIDFYDSYIDYLTFERDYAENTIGSHISSLKILLNNANRKGFDIDLGDFIKPSEESENIYLTIAELNHLFNFDLANKPSIERVRDLFIIGCWTGLRFSDLTSLTKDKIKNGLFSIRTLKTKAKVTIPMLGNSKDILKKYNYELPLKISNQKFNTYIKQACKLAGFTKEITKTMTKGGEERTFVFEKWERVASHTARRSFATNLYKIGVPHISIMAMTGHKTEKIFLDYIKVTPEEHAEKVKEIFDKMALEMANL